jgi:hypothetical protein
MPQKIKFTCYLQDDSICFPELNESICNEMGVGGIKIALNTIFILNKSRYYLLIVLKKAFVLQIIQYKPAW